MIDYYEFLQISPNADADTIHRVYRYLAARLHPDNPESGDAEMFRLLRSAFDTLSNPMRRAEYDAVCRREASEVKPLSESVDFMDSVEGELNRRVAVLAVLYFKRRANPRFPEVSLAEIERRMGFPRDYLDFTTWYLGKKGYITRADNSDFTLTAEGVDYIETQRVSLPTLNKLLTDGKAQLDKAVHAQRRKANGAQGADATNGRNGSGQIILPASMSVWLDRRQGGEDRRNKVVLRMPGSDRRTSSQDRRVNLVDRRQSKGDRRTYALVNVQDDPPSTRVQ
jgi:curved DNA-binding protein CbpA